MSSILNNLDFTSVKPQFLISGSQNYSTCLGGVISLINLIVLTLIIYAFGKNFFERTEPTLIQNVIYPERYPNYTLGLDMNFTYAFRLDDEDSNVIQREDLVYVDFLYEHYEIKDGEWILLKRKSLNVELCDQNKFERPDLFERQGFKSSYCPDFQNIEVGGAWDDTYIKYFKAEIRLCKEGGFNKKGQKCGTQQELKDLLKNRLYINSYYQEYFVDSNNYDKSMDIVYTNHFYLLDPLIMKKSTYNFRKGTIATDYGWILKDQDSLSKFTYDSYNSDFISISQLPENQHNVLGEIVLKFSKKLEKFDRYYEKIQNLAANVGGIIKVFYSLNMVIAYFFTVHMMNFDLISYTFDISNENGNKKCNHKNNNYSALLYSNNAAVNKHSKRGDIIKYMNNLKIIPKTPILKNDNNISINDEREKVDIEIYNEQSHNSPFDKQNTKIKPYKLFLSKYLKRHLFCKSIYSDKFKYLEEKLVSIIDFKKYIEMAYEFSYFINYNKKNLENVNNFLSDSKNNSLQQNEVKKYSLDNKLNEILSNNYFLNEK